jgi:SnoaL-like polyketide cyclase
MGIPPTGKQASGTGVQITHIANGKAIEQWFNGDDLGLLEQLGIVPATVDSTDTGGTVAGPS